MKLHKRIITALASLALILGIGVVTTQPAEALNSTWTKVYNSEYSDGCILVKVFDDPSVGYFQREVCPGGNSGLIYNANDNIRVDVESESCLTCDIDSYKIGEIGVGWGPCHEDSENSSSNPPDSYNTNEIRYRNYHDNNCEQ